MMLLLSSTDDISFVLALFPMLIFLLTLLPLFQIDPQQVKDMVSQMHLQKLQVSYQNFQ